MSLVIAFYLFFCKVISFWFISTLDVYICQPFILLNLWIKIDNLQQNICEELQKKFKREELINSCDILYNTVELFFDKGTYFSKFNYTLYTTSLHGQIKYTYSSLPAFSVIQDPQGHTDTFIITVNVYYILEMFTLSRIEPEGQIQPF